LAPDSGESHFGDENTTKAQSEASKSWAAHVTKEFNNEVKRAIDGAIYGIVGQDVLRALYEHLKEHYDVTPDEVPYRLDTVFETLEQTFGVKGARTISRAISKRLYYRLNLQFVETENFRLQDYLEQAKKQLALK
jgi:hypothetical protein